MRNLVFGGESGLLGRGLNNFNLCMEKSFEVLSKWPVRTAFPRPQGFHPLADVPFLAPEHLEPVRHCLVGKRVAAAFYKTKLNSPTISQPVHLGKRSPRFYDR
jgi:hypothetical protein